MKESTLEQTWVKIGSEGTWSPSERAGWWIKFALTARQLTEAYGPFTTNTEAVEYVRWVLDEAELNRFNEPAIVAALRATDEIAVVRY